MTETESATAGWTMSGRQALAGAFLGAAVVWFAIAALPGLLVGAEALGPGTAVTGALAGGAAAGCLAGAFARRAGGARRAAVAVAGGVLLAGAVVFVLPGVGAADLFGTGGREGLATRVGTGAVVLVSAAGGLGLALFAVRGAIWLRACALAVPIAFLQDAVDVLVPWVDPLELGTHWFGALVAGFALGMSVVGGRLWTWLMWVPALALVWFGQSLASALDATLQQVRLGADYLREYPVDPVLTLVDHLGHTLVDPGAHGAVAMWVIAVEAGVAVAAWRLRGAAQGERGGAAG